MKLGDIFPNFVADSTVGVLNWHEYIDGTWAVLFSHPADFTPVCTTELGTVGAYAEEFKRRNCQIAAISCDAVDSHKNWIQDIQNTSYSRGRPISYPIIADPDREVAQKLGMLDPEEKDNTGLPLACRAVFIIGPDKKLKLSILYPATTGRNFDEILRALDSLQLTDKHSVATPAQWTPGCKCMVVPTLCDQEAAKRFGRVEHVRVPSGRRYLRMVADPSPRRGPLRWAVAPIALLGLGLRSVGGALMSIGGSARGA
mmetsp:Transcript_12259/g.29103  ORF Transcript_12259/g.29103 Transcript_12259/m.29103 type:complete len:257 (-) Transcript_12259:173-943(-)